MNNQANLSLQGRRIGKGALKSLGLLLVVHALFLPEAAQANQKRYKAQSLNHATTKFYGRYGADLVNLQYIRADIVGTVKKAVREGKDVLGELNRYVVTNASGSVFVLPGVDAERLTIINDASGRPIAIKR